VNSDGSLGYNAAADIQWRPCTALSTTMSSQLLAKTE